MNPSHDPQDKLERALHETLRQLPARRAPASLEERVLAAIERKVALPWWRKSFAHWPLAARALFVVASIGLVRLAFVASVWAMSGFNTANFRHTVAERFAWVDATAAVLNAIGGSVEVVLRSLPPLWLYGGLAFFAALYVTLFGLGAAAFKAYHAHR